MSKLSYLEVSEHFKGNPEFVFINENKVDNSFLIRNSFLIGAKSLIINDHSHLEKAKELMFTVLVDERFPMTYGDRAEKERLYDYENILKDELIIDLRVTKPESVTFETQSVTKPESVTFETQSVTNNKLCLCGCEKALTGRQKYYSPTCRKRAERNRKNGH